MVPGQIAILVGALVCAAILGIMGVISFQSSKKERRLAARRKAREEARRLREEEDAAFEEQTRAAFETELAGDAAADAALTADEPVGDEDPDDPPAAPAGRSTRNDFDFKF